MNYKYFMLSIIIKKPLDSTVKSWNDESGNRHGLGGIFLSQQHWGLSPTALYKYQRHYGIISVFAVGRKVRPYEKR